MSNNRYIFLCVSFLLHGNSCFAQLDTFFVFAKSGLRLRDQPNREGKVITTIPYGAAVSMTYNVSKENKEIVDNIPGAWVFVNFDGKTGYLFDGYLSPLPAPTARDTTLLIYIEHHSRKTGSTIQFINPSGDDYGVTIQYFVLKDFLVCSGCYSNGDDWEGSSLRFDGSQLCKVDLADLYLLFTTIYNNDIERSKSIIKNGAITYNGKPINPETNYQFNANAKELHFVLHDEYTTIEIDISSCFIKVELY